MNTLGNKLQQHIANQFVCTEGFSSKALCLQQNFVVTPLMSQHVTQNQIRLNLCNLLQLQTSVAKTKIPTKILQRTRRDFSL